MFVALLIKHPFLCKQYHLCYNVSMGFTNKQEAFIREYPVDFNATQAALRAGYSKRTAGSIGHENLKKPEIAAAIDARIKKLAMGPDEVLIRLGQQARASIGDFVYFVEGSKKPFIDLKGAKEAGLIHLVKKFKYNSDGNIEFELYDSQSALVHIGKIHAMFTDKVKVEDWRLEVIELIQSGTITYDDVKAELGESLARELFSQSVVK